MADIQPGKNEPDIQEQLEGRSKINVNDWCLCNKCIRFSTDQECICCFELEKLHKLLLHSNKKTCITEISSFSKIILDEEVSHRLGTYIIQSRFSFLILSSIFFITFIRFSILHDNKSLLNRKIKAKKKRYLHHNQQIRCGGIFVINNLLIG